MKTLDVTVTRVIRGTADAVYDVWVDPKQPGSLWYGVERAIVTLAVDGLYYHSVQHEGRSWAHYGRFVALERGRRLEHTWMSEATRGCESVVSVTFTPKDGGTEVTLRHTGIPDDEMGRGHEGGWTWYLNTLSERFAQVTA